MMRFYLLIVWLMLVTLSTLAQDLPNKNYPTLDVLDAVILPANDPIDLVRRLHHIESAYVAPSQPPQWRIGDIQSFNVVNSSTQSEFSVNAELRGISGNVLLWVEDTAPITGRIAQQFVDLVDSSIYRQTQDLWGFREPGGIDGDPRLYILMTSGLDASLAGYFANIHTYPKDIVPNSNQHEMMIFNLSALGGYDILNPQVLTIIAHEYQHILRHFVDSNESTWLDEGFSMFTEHHIGWDAGRSQVIRFLTAPNVQLNQWRVDNQEFSRYGAVFLFVTYFAEQYGRDALRQLSDEPLDGWQGVDAVIAQIDNTSADAFFADWVLANYYLDIDKGYGYETLWNDLPSARPLASIINYPHTTAGRVSQYSTDYYVATNFQNASQLTLTYTSLDEVNLIPTRAFDGDYVYYSVPADNADVMLTRAFDLTDVDSATMTFHTWYDIEEFWDYAYVMASSDGERWDILNGTTTRDNNPYGRAYGEGYTGQSFGWVGETVSLDAYAGQEVLIRFEMITDAASIKHGMAIDNLQIDTIEYVDSFEVGSSDWSAQGWIRTDNRLPQHTWVQVVQQVGDDLILSRWLATETNIWTMDLVENVEQVLIAISPIAPQTMVDATYTLSLEIE